MEEARGREKKKKMFTFELFALPKKKKKCSIAMFLKRGYRTIWPIATFF